MAVISGSFDLQHEDNVSRIVESEAEPLGFRASGSVGVVFCTIESDESGLTNPSFRIQGPEVYGYLVRIGGWPASGSTNWAPTADFTLSVVDAYGSSWSYTIDKDGANDHSGTNAPVCIAGPIQLKTTNDLPAGKRFKISLVFDQVNNT